MSTLEPNELTRLLSEAVDPIRPSADAYRQIRAGIDRRRRWRLPAFTLGGMVMAALIALAVVAIRPSPSNQLVEPAVPPVVPSNYTGPTPAGTGSGPSGSGSTHGGGQSSGGRGPAASGGASTPPSSPGTRPTLPTTTSPTVSASPSSPSSSTGPGVNSPPLPSPAARPAGAGDIDGDGRSDDVSSDGATVRVTFSRDAVVARVTLPEISVPLTSAVVDIDGDGFGELLVQTSDSGGTKSYALLHYIGLDTLVAVAPPTGFTLTSGTHTNTASGFRCGDHDHDLEISVGTSTDGNAFSVTTTALTLSRDGLTVTGSPATSTVRLPSDTSPFVPGCGSLS